MDQKNKKRKYGALRKFSDHKPYNCELVNKILFAKGFMEKPFSFYVTCYNCFQNFWMSQVSLPALGPKTSTPLGKDPPLGTLSSSEVVCGATPFPRQRISMGSSPPQVLSMFSLTINDVILFHFLRNIFFPKKDWEKNIVKGTTEARVQICLIKGFKEIWKFNSKIQLQILVQTWIENLDLNTGLKSQQKLITSKS